MAWRPLGVAPLQQRQQAAALPPLPPLLPPQPVTEAAPRKYLDGILGEARRCLDAEPGSLIEQRRGYAVYARPVERGKGLTMCRLEAEVEMPPDDLFALMTSMDGKMIIDPFPREHHSELVKPLRLAGGDARVVYSEAPRFAGLLRPREYVTCDALQSRERLFVCKSAELPHGPLAAPKKGMVRANLLFAMRMLPVEGEPGRCRMQMVNWLDLGRDTVPTWLANGITERWYMQALLRRLRRYTAKHGLAPAGT